MRGKWVRSRPGAWVALRSLTFHVGSVTCDDGEALRVGTLTIGTGHAGLSLREAEARAHYEHAGTPWALVRAVDGEKGIWVSGVVLPDVPLLTFVGA